MSSDAMTISAVLSWTFGLLTVVFVGLALPFFISVLPDAVALLRRECDWKSLTQMSVLALGSAGLGVYFASRTGAVGTPSSTVWCVLAILLAVASASALAPMTVVRAARRRSSTRARNHLLDTPLRSIRPDVMAFPPPAARESALHWREAEFLAADWMRHLGASDVEVTPERRDGGIDVVSSDAFAQVKCFERDLVGVEFVRSLVGVAHPKGRRALFFATTSFTPDAQEYARETRTALFLMRSRTGQLLPIGPLAQAILRDGLSSCV